MRVPRLIIIVTAWASISFVAASPHCLADRATNVYITVDGAEVFKQQSWDQGERNCDEVWNSLKDVVLERGEAFDSLNVPADAKEVLLGKDGIGEPWRVAISMEYGGQVKTQELRILRVPPNERGDEWIVDPAAVDELFRWRYVRRTEVEHLLADLAEPLPVSSPQRTSPLLWILCFLFPFALWCAYWLGTRTSSAPAQ